MQELPLAIREYILKFIDENKSPAYFMVDREGRLLEWGGDSARYGLPELKKGIKLVDQLYYLEGLLSPLEHPEIISCVNIEGIGYLDIHVIPKQNNIWVLFLSVETKVANGINKLQKVTQLSRCSKKISGIAIALYADLFYEMEILVLEYKDGDRFCPLGQIPAWFNDNYTIAKISTEELKLFEVFPFLTGFFDNALKHWELKTCNGLRSGILTVDEIEGKTGKFEAYASIWGDKKIMYIQYFEDQQA